MSDISIAESKIQILYLVDRAPGVSYHLLMEKCMESLYTDFFTFSRSYEELISGNLMDKSSSGAFTGDAVGSTENLTLTDGGRAVLNDLLSSLNAPLRARLDEAASAIVSEMAANSGINASMEMERSRFTEVARQRNIVVYRGSVNDWLLTISRRLTIATRYQ